MSFTQASHHPTYRPEIDGLRAVAVIPVIFFHLGVTFFSRGFIGVDIFFVISGYLISLKLLEELAQGNLSLVGFYQNRAKRILPALNTMMLATAIAALILMPPDELSSFGESLFYTSAFLANHFFLSSTDYFAPAADTLPLLHTWSLAVEEQFYFGFPLLLGLLWKKCRRYVFPALLGMLVFSYLLHLLGTKNFPASSYFYLATRAWELLAGSALAFHVSRANRQLAKPAMKVWGSCLGLACITLSLVGWPGDQPPAPYLWTLLPVIGTVLLIGSTDKHQLLGKVLASRAMVYVGRLSFSLYLWHFPIFAFAKIQEHTHHEASPIVLLLTSLVIVSAASFHWIENPIRYLKNPGLRFWLAMISVQTGLLAFGYALHRHTSFFKTYTPGQELVSAKFNFQAPSLSWQLCEQATLENPCVGGDTQAKAKIVLIGDSHVFTLFDALSQQAKELNLKLVLYTKGNCPPLWVEDPSGYTDKCLQANQRVFEHLIRQADIHAVVLSARWAWYFHGTGFDNGQKGYIGKPSPFMKQLPLNSARRHIVLSDWMQQTVTKLSQFDHDLYVINTIPEPGWLLHKKSIDLALLPIDIEQTLRYDKKVFFARNKAVDDALAGFVKTASIRLIQASSVLCPEEGTPVKCLTWQQGLPLYADDNHLTPVGARLVAEEFRRQWR